MFPLNYYTPIYLYIYVSGEPLPTSTALSGEHILTWSVDIIYIVIYINY